jgi:hypothetical protein
MDQLAGIVFPKIHTTTSNFTSHVAKLCSRFGGPELLEQVWPVNKLTASNLAMVTSYENHRGIVDRYWVSSEGIYFFAEPSAPLFIDSNTAANPNQLCFVSKNEAPFYQTENVTLRHEPYQ